MFNISTRTEINNIGVTFRSLCRLWPVVPCIPDWQCCHNSWTLPAMARADCCRLFQGISAVHTNPISISQSDSHHSYHISHLVCGECLQWPACSSGLHNVGGGPGSPVVTARTIHCSVWPPPNSHKNYSYTSGCPRKIVQGYITHPAFIHLKHRYFFNLIIWICLWII